MHRQIIPSKDDAKAPRFEGCGFTLIELLVVISILGILIALMLPALGRTKDATRALICQSNQKQLITAWVNAMAENDSKIPYITSAPGPNSPARTRWWGLLKEQFGELQALDPAKPAAPDNPMLCPVIEEEHDRPFYGAIFFGYAVNSRWSDCGTNPESELRSWDNISAPSDYPWFTDPETLHYPPAYLTRATFGRMGTIGPGVGFFHTGETSNAAFADGHVETFSADSLEDLQPCGTPRWLLAEY